MAEKLQSVPACKLGVSDEQYRAVGHVALQWSLLENLIDHEILWLNTRCTEQVNLRCTFEDRAEGWKRLAAAAYADHAELINGVADMSERAIAVKPERDRLVHSNLTSRGIVIRKRRGEVTDILHVGKAPQIEDLACRISDITSDYFRHWSRLIGVFEDALMVKPAVGGTVA